MKKEIYDYVNYWKIALYNGDDGDKKIWNSICVAKDEYNNKKTFNSLKKLFDILFPNTTIRSTKVDDLMDELTEHINEEIGFHKIKFRKSKLKDFFYSLQYNYNIEVLNRLVSGEFGADTTNTIRSNNNQIKDELIKRYTLPSNNGLYDYGIGLSQAFEYLDVILNSISQQINIQTSGNNTLCVCIYALIKQLDELEKMLEDVDKEFVKIGI